MAFSIRNTLATGFRGSIMKPAVPGKPTATASGTTITVSWTGVAGATSYEVVCSIGGLTTQTITSGTAATFTGTAGSTYAFTVAAINSGGKSSTSVASDNVVLALPVPATPATPTVTISSVILMTVTWTEVLGAQTYEVVCSKGNLTTKTGLTGLSVNFLGGAGTVYKFTVAAVNSGGKSAASPESNSVATPPYGFLWRVYYNYFGGSNFMNTAVVGSPDSTATPTTVTVAPINLTWGSWGNSQSSTAVSINRGIVTDMTNLLTATNNIINNGDITGVARHNFSVEWLGYFVPNVSGTWTFTTDSDDASYLWIDNDTNAYAKNGYNISNAIVNNGNDHATQVRSGTAVFTFGLRYFIRAQFGENGGGYDMRITNTPPGGTASYNFSGLVYSYDIAPVTGLLYYYRFNTGDINSSNKIANYATGTAVYDATVYGSPSFSTATTTYKVGGSSLQLVGTSSQYINIDAFTSTTDGITISCWFNFSVGGWTRLFDFGNGSANNNILYAPENGLSVFHGGGAATQPGGGNTNAAGYADSTWHFFAWTLSCTDTANNRGTWNVYIDNVLKYTNTNAGYPRPVSRSNNYIGFSNWSSDGYSTGYINEFRYYTRVLSVNELTLLYNLT